MKCAISGAVDARRLKTDFAVMQKGETMDDLISRQDALDALEWKWAGKAAIDAIKNLPSAQQWIPCSERLPNTNGVYNVTRKISDGFECRNISDTCYYDGTNTWHDDTRVNHGRRYLTDVIAWMPLPEPYKEERE